MIGEIFGNISSFRHESSVVHMLKIREQYGGKTSGKPFLTPFQKDIVAYISGYVCRKTRDCLQHYSSDRFLRIAHAMSYPNIMTLSLTTGRLTQVDHATYNFPFVLFQTYQVFVAAPDSWIVTSLISG